MTEPDPFEDFDEQQQSYELLEQHRQALTKDAVEFEQGYPGLPYVGLILHADASEADAFRNAIEQACGQKLPGRGFFGVVPRPMVLDILRANHPQSLDWLVDSGGDGAERILPLVAVTKSGLRCGQTSFRMDG